MSDERVGPGRPTLYTEQIASEICARLADGEPLRQICRDQHMPNKQTVRGWAAEDRDGFSSRYAGAREAGLREMGEELIEIADDGTNDWQERETAAGRVTKELDGEHVTRSRLRIDARKWLLSKMLPKEYGDKSALEVTGAGGAPLVQFYIPENGRDGVSPATGSADGVSDKPS